MHRTVFGRRCYAVGNNEVAAWVAGVDVARLKVQAYALAGGLAGVASLVWIGQYGSARGDNADGSILFVVTAVVLGGIDINGGSGSILGVVLALFLLGTLRNGMGLANVPGPTQTVVFGALLIVGVLRPVIARLIAHALRSGVPVPPRRELGRRPPLSTAFDSWVHQETVARQTKEETMKIRSTLFPPRARAGAQHRRLASAPAQDSGFKLMMTPKWTGFPYFEAAARGRGAAEELGDEFVYAGADHADVTLQVETIQNFLTQKPDAIILAAIDLNAVAPVLKEARARVSSSPPSTPTPPPMRATCSSTSCPTSRPPRPCSTAR